MSAGPIPWTAINEYADRYRYTDDEFEELATLVQAMDAVFLDHMRTARK